MKSLLNVRTLGTALAVAMMVSLGACAQERGEPFSSAMQLGSATMAPRGYLQFCLRRPDQCGLRTPVTEIRDEALKAALNREEWTNVLALRPPPAQLQTVTTAAPSAPAPQPLAIAPSAVETEFAPVREIAGLDAGAQIVLDVELQPAPTPVVVSNSDASVSASIREMPATPMSTPQPTRDAAPKLDDLFQDVHRVIKPVVLHYNPALWNHLEAVNADINARIRPRTDWQAFGIEDYWTLPLDSGGRGEGNCKHYALEKRRELIEDGVSEDALSLAVVRTPQGETHAVLIVATDRGDFVLDNLTPDIRGWRDTGYTWLTRQTPGDPLRWASVQTALAVAEPSGVLRVGAMNRR